MPKDCCESRSKSKSNTAIVVTSAALLTLVLILCAWVSPFVHQVMAFQDSDRPLGRVAILPESHQERRTLQRISNWISRILTEEQLCHVIPHH